jgi:hypothetical protein
MSRGGAPTRPATQPGVTARRVTRTCLIVHRPRTPADHSRSPPGRAGRRGRMGWGSWLPLRFRGVAGLALQPRNESGTLVAHAARAEHHRRWSHASLALQLQEPGRAARDPRGLVLGKKLKCRVVHVMPRELEESFAQVRVTTVFGVESRHRSTRPRGYAGWWCGGMNTLAGGARCGDITITEHQCYTLYHRYDR